MNENELIYPISINYGKKIGTVAAIRSFVEYVRYKSQVFL